MRFKLVLKPSTTGSIIPINYQYPISAAIYKILSQANGDYAHFLHETGYRTQNSLKNFKLFTFSDLQLSFKLLGDRMKVLSDMELTVSFHMPQAAENFVKGLFLSQSIDIADKKSKAVFKVATVEALTDPFAKYDKQEILNVTAEPCSPLVVGIKNENGEYTFLPPTDARFGIALTYNWRAKLQSVGLTVEDDALQLKVLQPLDRVKKRGVFIKAGTTAQTKIIGYTKFKLNITAQKEYLEVLYNAGTGLYNAQGMGCLQTKLNLK